MLFGLRRIGRRHVSVTLVAMLLAARLPGRAQQGPPQLVVTSAVADPNGALTISGQNFAVVSGRFGNRPFVTLDLVPLDIRLATDTAILSTAPSGAIPPGTYLLTVSRGPNPAENASLDVTVGAPVASAATTGSAVWAASLPSVASGTTPAAQVGDRAISIDDVDREWRRSDPSGYLQLVRQLYEARRQVLTTMVNEQLLAREAAARGVSVEALVAEEVPKRVIAMPDSAVASLFASLGDNARGATLDQMRPAIRAWLEKRSEPELAKMSFVDELKKVSTRADILLDAPRIQVERTAPEISLGSSSAPVEIVAFGDFQSNEYARFAQVFPRVRDTFGDRLRLTFKNLPTLGPQSAAAAEAALCANAQQKFWPYHDALVEPGVVDSKRLVDAATSLGIDRNTFTGCLERHEFHDAVQHAMDEGERYGLHGSPSFLINGRLAPPPPPFLAAFDYFKLLIEEELSRVASTRAR